MAQRTIGHADPSALWQRALYIGSLMLAGESIYMLPYMRKTFQTSMEEVFAISAAQVGLLNSMFGILALVCYFPGGWFADRFPARRLLTLSLVSTGLGGFTMVLGPGFAGLLAIHAFWGITSILMFWAALIKATRNWGGAHEQAFSFGLLDGGRGVLAAVLATLATALFATFERGGDTAGGLISVIVLYSAAPIAVGGLVWFFIPDSLHENEPEQRRAERGSTRRSLFARAARIPDVWLLGGVIFCAYILFLGTYELPAFVERGYGESKVTGATLGTFRDWMRPVGAIGAGLLADRLTAGRMVAASFALLMAGFASLFLIPAATGLLWMLWIQVAVVALAVFALRGIYYALLREMGIPMAMTGTTVGIVSVIGYTPDIFLHLVAGVLTQGGGIAGYQNYFGLMAIVATAGLVISIVICIREKTAHESA